MVVYANHCYYGINLANTSKVNNNFTATFLCFFILTGASFAQHKPALPRLYACSREILNGIRPSEIADESGNISIRTAKPSVQYFIYVESAAIPAIEIKSVWIDGRSYYMSTKKINTPAIIQNSTVPGNANDTLVASTKNTVWQILLREQKKEDKKSGMLIQLINKNAIVISYASKGKTRLLAIKGIKKLSPVSLQ